MPVVLRPYQERDVAAIRATFKRTRSCIWRSPTGSGKSTASAFVLGEAASRSMTGWFLTHRKELVSQASRTFNGAGIPHGIIASGFTPCPRETIQIASVQTVAKRIGKLPAPRFIVMDECHHAVAESYVAIRKAYPDAFVLGLTATPLRLDGRGLGPAAGGLFVEMVLGPSAAELIDDGYLSPYTLFAPPSGIDVTGMRTGINGDFSRGELAKKSDKPVLIGEAVEKYRSVCPGERAIAFAVNVAHAEHIAAQFNAAGFKAASIDGDMTPTQRSQRITALERGDIDVLASCDLIGEGLDIPAVTAAILCRRTKSLGLWMQQSGRPIRPVYAPGRDLSTRQGRRDAIADGSKPMAYIFDHADNSFGGGHGFIDEPRDWSLEKGVKARKAGDGTDRFVKVRQCQSCFAAFPPADECPHCGAMQASKQRDIEIIPGDLQAVVREEAMAQRRAEKELYAAQRAKDIRAARTHDAIEAVRIKYGYRPAWTHFRKKALHLA